MLPNLIKEHYRATLFLCGNFRRGQVKYDFQPSRVKHYLGASCALQTVRRYHEGLFGRGRNQPGGSQRVSAMRMNQL
jgi:hypothetical protein